MGLTYILFRLQYGLQRHLGVIKLRFPKKTSSELTPFITQEWEGNLGVFFQTKTSFPNVGDPFFYRITADRLKELESRIIKIRNHEYPYFVDQWFQINDWHSHPKTRYRYREDQHWSEVPEFSQEAGDIKYLWEKGRFTFLYDLIRYERHSGVDQFNIVLSHILDWIKRNPVNCGPHWVCSQEISLRVLNWIFAVKFYQNRIQEPLLLIILQSIDDQMNHVWENRSYARRLVRNNHVLTEALALYSIGILFPFFKRSNRWKEYGKTTFEQEIDFQIKSDGSYIQHSMNYHRVLLQLLTWALRLGEINEDPFSVHVYHKAQRALEFMMAMQDSITGWLPHYGPQDGALFFPLTQASFRDYRPQISSLAQILGVEISYEAGLWQEDNFWWGIKPVVPKTVTHSIPAIFNFKNGGYFVLKDSQSSTFIRCASYPTRPYQADNLHLDIWANGRNILRDAGTFNYLEGTGLARYFRGTLAHNTVQIDAFDQMLRGPRFVWSQWIKESSGEWRYEAASNAFVFYGYFVGFRQLNRRIIHRRMISKSCGKLQWWVEDWLEGVPEDMEIRQIWHPGEGYGRDWGMDSFDEAGEIIVANQERGWYASNYGSMESALQLVFTTKSRYLKTCISWNAT
ncbi:heparinase II/III family protein [Dyadobacter tibetensis]|uniref:heparinase II/III family protein n=1 Tax=Dyadobacter tibetensis TaxID=1211851 RepID=UPI0018DEA4D7|nr:alginate lyase family protein [Dyadobacter tibetensis]